MSSLTDIARLLWSGIKNEKNRAGNTAQRVGDAAMSLIDAIESLESALYVQDSYISVGDVNKNATIVGNSVSVISGAINLMYEDIFGGQKMAIGASNTGLQLGDAYMPMTIKGSQVNISNGNYTYSLLRLFDGTSGDVYHSYNADYAEEAGYCDRIEAYCFTDQVLSYSATGGTFNYVYVQNASGIMVKLSKSDFKTWLNS